MWLHAGANEKQPTILHVTLARILKADLQAEQIGQLIGASSQASKQLRGKSFRPSALWFASVYFLFSHSTDAEECGD